MNDFIFLLVIIGCIMVAARLYRGTAAMQAKASRHCMTCGSDGVPTSRVKGSLGIEIILWVCFLVPGLIYSLWRMNSRHSVCASCAGTELVPMESPAALSHKKSLQM